MARLSRASSLVLLVFGPAVGLTAQDFFGGGLSAQTAARAGIYVSGGDDALDALALNPAGLSALTSPVLNLSGSGLLARGSFRNAANRNSPMRLTAGGLPYGAFGLPVSKRWTAAVGFLPDLLSSANWQFRDAPGAAGASYGSQREKSEILVFRTTAGFAYQVSSRVSAGVTVSVFNNSNTLAMPYVFQSHPELKGLKTLLDLHTSGLGWNTSFGAIARPSRHWELGATYRGKSTITSTGDSTGNMGVQFAALGIPFRPDFAYRAQVKAELPQAASLSATWRKSPVLRFSAESKWIDWRSSFAALPVSLTKGTNADINRFLKSDSIRDNIPLHWKDQFSFRVAFERLLGEGSSVAGGYVHQNSPVPSSTLSPLTAAIMTNGLSAGIGHSRGHARFDLAYQLNLTAEQNVGASTLLLGEFSNSRVRVGTQGLTLSTSFRL